jgi:hypothetical protein
MAGADAPRRVRHWRLLQGQAATVFYMSNPSWLSPNSERMQISASVLAAVGSSMCCVASAQT